MPDTATLALFLIASLTLAVVPGPAVMYIVARGIHQGRLAGLVSALGIEAGTLVHVVVAAVGLSSLLASSALAFATVKYLGVAYLLYLGARTLASQCETDGAGAGGSESLRHIFAHGVVIEVLNPKTVLFFVAFLPQFVDPASGPLARQMLVLGILFVLLATLVDGIYGLLSGTLGAWLADSSRLLTAQRYFSGCIYTTLAVTMAMTGFD